MDRVHFTINGEKYSAGGEFPAETSLNEFIRRHADLRGTKYMCKEAGCGVCVVHVRLRGSSRGEDKFFAANSCLTLVFSCDNWDITTIEGIGNRKMGYHILQQRLHHYFGSQCGFCSPGFIMTMYSLLQKQHDVTEADIETAFAGSLCRCTGYRPILEAFKSLAVNVNPKILDKIKDIEDIDRHVCPRSGRDCNDSCSKEFQEWCMINTKVEDLPAPPVVRKKIKLADGRIWFAPRTIKDIFEILDEVGYDSFMLVGGNTYTGVRPIRNYPKILIDVYKVKELQNHYLDQNLVLGANMTVTDTMTVFGEIAKSNEDFSYLDNINSHFQRVGHTPIRDISSLAGNLILKHNNLTLQSDIFVLFDCVGGIITLMDRKRQETEVTFPEFLKTNIDGKVIINIKLPPLSKQHKLVSYKVTPREQNAYGEVNSAFLFKFDTDNRKVLKASLTYAGINKTFTHAYETENFLIGQNLFNNEVLQEALRILKSEIRPIENPPDPSPEFRQMLSVSLFYKCIIRLCPSDILRSIYQNAGTSISEDRPGVTTSFQEFATDKSIYPLNQPVLKKDGLVQCAGEALFADDIPTMKGEVFAAFVLATISKGQIESVDPTEAMKINGVITVLTSADIPGKNSYIRVGFLNQREDEEVLASDTIAYFNQPVAILVATTQTIADRAANFVKVNYKNISKRSLVLKIEDAIRAPKDENRIVRYPGIEPAERGEDVTKVIRGQFYSPSAYHFMLELHTTIVRPADEGLEVFSSTQFMDHIQATIAQVLNIPNCLITVVNRRCGGGFGCKLHRANIVACAAALVCRKLNKPCRMAMSMPDIMRASGKRCDTLLNYEVGVDDKGEIQYLDSKFYINDGNSSNENENEYSIKSIKSVYDFRRWKVESLAVYTDLPSNAFMRGPGSYEGVGAIEHVMDHIAFELNIDPLIVRESNYRKEDNIFPELMPTFLKRIDYEERQNYVREFNARNRWKKRGFKYNIMVFPTSFIGNYSAIVSVFHGDGSVAIHIGGNEVGQGIFTKMEQIVASEFGIPVETVSVYPSMNTLSPNNYGTASSITTECCANSVVMCCRQILERIAPFREAMPNASWQQVVFEADEKGVNLQANYLTSPIDPEIQDYSIFGIGAIEVEVDILTGRKWIVRADVFEDTGRSINPALDIGQVEGAYIQGISSWIMEGLKYDKQTGELYTDRTWNYNIMGAKDIPVDFRVYLRKQMAKRAGILGAKGVGEPPICVGYALVEALRAAIQSSRHDSGYDTDKYLNLNVPVSNEVVLQAADPKLEEFLLY